MDDRTEHQVIRDMLLQILGELKVANEIALTKEAFDNEPLSENDYMGLTATVMDIREVHKP